MLIQLTIILILCALPGLYVRRTGASIGVACLMSAMFLVPLTMLVLLPVPVL